ncbi:hypothetical protein K474DRAFT_1583309, partial [Panus rudis PR-1116 ss-1]
LVVHMSPELRDRFIHSYSKDPHFKAKLETAAPSYIPEFKGQCFFKDKSGLLFMRINNEPARLCVPKEVVPYILHLIHDSPFEGAHEG